MKKLTLNIGSILILVVLAGCSSVSTKSVDSVDKYSAYIANKVLQAKGYSKLSQFTEIQNELVIEQSAKLNAYRDLAKQLYSTKLSEQLAIADQVIKDEIYRIYLDLFLREARIVESTNIADQRMVILELDLSARFYHCISTTVNVVSKCLQEDNKIPFTRIGYQQATKSTVNLACATSNCGAQISVSGFSKEKSALNSALQNAGLYDTEWTINIALRSMVQYFLSTGHLLN